MTPTPEQQQIALKTARDVVGLDESSAKNVIVTNGCTWRVRSRDGAYYIGTNDVEPLRINLTIEKETVTKATTG